MKPTNSPIDITNQKVGVVGLSAPGRCRRRIITVGIIPAISARIAALGSTPLAMNSIEFGAFMAAETAKWAKVVKLSGAKPD